MAKDWFPVVDYGKCSGCLTCFNFCPNGVFEVEKGKPKVVKPEKCIEFCQGCGRICPQDAIKFITGENKRKQKKIK